jgi:hypothetical protein
MKLYHTFDSHLHIVMIGVYLVLACITFWIMNERRKDGNSVNIIITSCCVVIFLCTGIVRTTLIYVLVWRVLMYAQHWGGTVAQVFEGLVEYGMNSTVGLALLYGNTTRVAIMRLAIYGLAGMSIDIMLVRVLFGFVHKHLSMADSRHLFLQIYRLWIVWGRAWKIIILPMIFTGVGLVSSTMIMYFAATTTVGDITPALKISITTSFSLHASTNIICTGSSLY